MVTYLCATHVVRGGGGDSTGPLNPQNCLRNEPTNPVLLACGVTAIDTLRSEQHHL